MREINVHVKCSSRKLLILCWVFFYVYECLIIKKEQTSRVESKSFRKSQVKRIWNQQKNALSWEINEHFCFSLCVKSNGFPFFQFINLFTFLMSQTENSPTDMIQRKKEAKKSFAIWIGREWDEEYDEKNTFKPENCESNDGEMFLIEYRLKGFFFDFWCLPVPFLSLFIFCERFLRALSHIPFHKKKSHINEMKND